MQIARKISLCNNIFIKSLIKGFYYTNRGSNFGVTIGVLLQVTALEAGVTNWALDCARLLQTGLKRWQTWAKIMRKHCQVIPEWKKSQSTFFGLSGKGVGFFLGGGEGEEGGWGYSHLSGQWLSDSGSFYLVRLPVEGGTIITEPVSFVLRLLADLVLFSGEASFLWKETWYTLNWNVCTVHENLLTYMYPNIIRDNLTFKACTEVQRALFKTISNYFKFQFYLFFFARPHWITPLRMWAPLLNDDDDDDGDDSDDDDDDKKDILKTKIFSLFLEMLLSVGALSYY